MFFFKMKTNMKRVLLAAFVLILFFPLSAFAASGHETQHISLLIPYWVNFIIFVLVMYFLLRKAFSQSWQKRRDTISRAVHAGEEQLKLAKQRLEEAREQQESLVSQLGKLRETILKEGDMELQRIRRDGDERAEFVKKQAERTLESEKLALEVELRKELAARVMEKASERLKNEISEEEDSYLRSKAVEGLGALVATNN